MKRLLAAAIAALVSTTLAAQPPPTGAVARRTTDGHRLVDVTLPGELLDAAVAGDLYLLVAPPVTAENPEAEGARGLYRLDIATPRLVPVNVEMPARANRLEAVPGEPPRLFVGLPGRILEVDRSDGRLTPRVAGRSWDLHGRLPGALGLAPSRSLYIQTPGAIRDADGAALATPIEAAREGWGFRVTTPPATDLGMTGSDGRRFAVGPLPAGGARLRTVLLTDAPAAEPEEAWSELPEPETPWTAHYALEPGPDGSTVPLLIVTTHASDRIGVFERRRLRVFRLRPDRRRAGTPPVLEAQMGARRWHEVSPWWIDADGDGRLDLAVARQSGLGGGESALELFPGLSPRARTVDLEGASDGWWFGGDLDGDGLPDLALTNDGGLRLHRGRTSGRPVEKKPFASVDAFEEIEDPTKTIEIGTGGTRVETDETPGPPRLLVGDLDGDGTPEVVASVAIVLGRGRVRVLTPR